MLSDFRPSKSSKRVVTHSKIATEPFGRLASVCFFSLFSFLLIKFLTSQKFHGDRCALILLQTHFRSRTLCLLIMRLHILIPAILAGAVLTAAGPLITDASLIAQTQAEITSCRQCSNNLCGLCPPSLFCSACFDKANCYACPYMESCVEDKSPCICYDFCSKGICKGTDDCVGDPRSAIRIGFNESLSADRYILNRKPLLSSRKSVADIVKVSV